MCFCGLLCLVVLYGLRVRLFFFEQRTAYDMRISDWSSDVCSSDLSCGPRTTSPSAPAWPRGTSRPPPSPRSEERRVGKSVSVRVDPGGRRIIKKNTPIYVTTSNQIRTTKYRHWEQTFDTNRSPVASHQIIQQSEPHKHHPTI